LNIHRLDTLAPTQVPGDEHANCIPISEVLAFVNVPMPYFGYFSEYDGNGRAEVLGSVHDLDKT
jgi:hypothetical protein